MTTAVISLMLFFSSGISSNCGQFSNSIGGASGNFCDTGTVVAKQPDKNIGKISMSTFILCS